jgi:DNA polymerase-3 subunit delta'
MIASTGIYPWQAEAWQLLSSYFNTSRIPQAVLLTGLPGLGKMHLANVYANLLLCSNPSGHGFGCGFCSSCKLFLAKTHPDYLSIEPEEAGKVIGVDKIRYLIAKLALKPQHEGYRITIFQPADSLNIAAANAFLKCLEEPTERSSFILIAANPAKLPATIRSRCQHIHLNPPDKTSAVQWLKLQNVQQDHLQLLEMASGAPLLAKTYAETQLAQIRSEYFQTWLNIAQDKVNLLIVAEQWQKQEAIELSVLLSWMSDWISDIVKLAYSVESVDISNTDFKKHLQLLADRLRLTNLFRHYDLLLQSRLLLTTQVNKQLLIESLLIDWQRINQQ